MAIDVPAPEAWAFYASASAYFVEDEPDYVQPTISADRGLLHLEARYNYEDHDTGSAWIGCNLAAGDRFTAADTQLATAVGYTMNVLKVLPQRPVFRDYLARVSGRPAYQRYQRKDGEAAMRIPYFQKMFPDGPPPL